MSRLAPILTVDLGQLHTHTDMGVPLQTPPHSKSLLAHPINDEATVMLDIVLQECEEENVSGPYQAPPLWEVEVRPLHTITPENNSNSTAPFGVS